MAKTPRNRKTLVTAASRRRSPRNNAPTTAAGPSEQRHDTILLRLPIPPSVLAKRAAAEATSTSTPAPEVRAATPPPSDEEAEAVAAKIELGLDTVSTYPIAAAAPAALCSPPPLPATDVNNCDFLMGYAPSVAMTPVYQMAAPIHTGTIGDFCPAENLGLRKVSAREAVALEAMLELCYGTQIETRNWIQRQMDAMMIVHETRQDGMVISTTQKRVRFADEEEDGGTRKRAR
ncbi:hypothetical protein HDU96_007464 [Phlyctochytrium bullatum]|nr:hypothetical protein HDU96_007464 [Phlyctochytrium bullatum]